MEVPVFSHQKPIDSRVAAASCNLASGPAATARIIPIARRTLFRSLFTFLTLLSLPAAAGIVRTLDGKTYEGQVSLDPSGKILVTPIQRGAKPISLELSTILQASFRDGAARDVAAPPVRTELGKLPPGWEALPIGPQIQPHYAKYTDGNYSIKSAGGEIGAKRDSLCLVRSIVPGDAEIVARLIDVKNTQRVVAGLMLRSTPEPDSPYAALIYTNTELFFFRRNRAGESTDQGTIAVRATTPLWLKLTRRSGTVAVATSRDGNTWEQLASEAFALDGPALMGLAMCGKERGEAMGGHFDSVRISAFSTGAAAMPTTLKRGLMLRSGTLLADAEIARADDSAVRYSKAERRDVSISLVNVARIIFRDLTPESAAKIPEKRPGVLLKNGDFVEGTLRAYRDGRIELSSVLFGLQRFDANNQVQALILNDPEPRKGELIILTTDNSVYIARSVKIESDRLVVEDSAGGAFTLSRSGIAEIAAGPGRLEPLLKLKPIRIEPRPTRSGEGLTVGGTAAGLPMSLGGAPVESGMTLSAGSSATWDLGRAYHLLTFRAGVPSGVAPTVPVRFIVLADGKELFRSKPRTSLDEPLSGTIELNGVKELTLKVDPATPETAALAIPGLWAGLALAK